MKKPYKKIFWTQMVKAQECRAEETEGYFYLLRAAWEGLWRGVERGSPMGAISLTQERGREPCVWWWLGDRGLGPPQP